MQFIWDHNKMSFGLFSLVSRTVLQYCTENLSKHETLIKVAQFDILQSHKLRQLGGTLIYLLVTLNISAASEPKAFIPIWGSQLHARVYFT